jgi:pimeloyl-ACP methyl ester carboxylesterase
MVLLCPSGLGDDEHLPVVEGVRRNDLKALLDSVFVDPRHVEPDMVKYYQTQFANRRWRLGLMRTIRGTMDHCVREQLTQVRQPTLLITGCKDRIVSPAHAEEAARVLPQGYFLAVPDCGHAPQIEKAKLINRLVVQFLTDTTPDAHSQFSQLALADPSSP